jgi:hypothetical protein
MRAVRIVVFALLIAWALYDAVLSAAQMPTFWSGVVAFGLSLGWSLLFILLIHLIWGWVAHRFRRAKEKAHQAGGL